MSSSCGVEAYSRTDGAQRVLRSVPSNAQLRRCGERRGFDGHTRPDRPPGPAGQPSSCRPIRRTAAQRTAHAAGGDDVPGRSQLITIVLSAAAAPTRAQRTVVTSCLPATATMTIMDAAIVVTCPLRGVFSLPRVLEGRLHGLGHRRGVPPAVAGSGRGRLPIREPHAAMLGRLRCTHHERPRSGTGRYADHGSVHARDTPGRDRSTPRTGRGRSLGWRRSVFAPEHDPQSVRPQSGVGRCRDSASEHGRG